MEKILIDFLNSNANYKQKNHVYKIYKTLLMISFLKYFSNKIYNKNEIEYIFINYFYQYTLILFLLTITEYKTGATSASFCFIL